jgi:Calx-beta domain-containing protein
LAVVNQPTHKETKMSITARRIAAPLAMTAALLGAGTAHAAPPAITTDTVDEGEAFVLPISAKCQGAKRCSYQVTTVDGTAVAGGDYTAATASGSVKKKRTFATTLTVPTTDDTAPESTETFQVRVTVKRGQKVAAFTATETITDSDTATPTPPTPPTPTPTTPPDTGTVTTTTTATSQGLIKECRTPFWTGVNGQFGANGFYNSGCTVQLPCPAGTAVCSVSNESAINNETNNGTKVSLNTRTRAISASGNVFWFRDQSCSADDWCRAEDRVNIRGGESATVQCNGVRAVGNLPNRSSVRCSIQVEKLY